MLINSINYLTQICVSLDFLFLFYFAQEMQDWIGFKFLYCISKEDLVSLCKKCVRFTIFLANIFSPAVYMIINK